MANDLIFDFLLPFSEAIDQAKARDVTLADYYYSELEGQAKASAFTVSYLASVQQVAAVLTSLVDAMEGGATFDMWKDGLGPEAEGLTDPHLETVYRNAFQTAYNAGRMRQQAKNASLRPYLMYDAINDSRTRPNHAALDNFIAPVGAAIWNSIYPPCGHNCRCAVMSLTAAQAKARGWNGKLTPTEGGADEGWDHPPSDAFQTNVDLLRKAADGAGVELEKLAGELADAAEKMQKDV